MVPALVLPWFHIVYTPTGQVTSNLYSPVGAFLAYPSQCAVMPSPSICASEMVAGFVIMQFPFLLAVSLAVLSVMRSPSYGITALAGIVSVGIWTFFGYAASNAEPVWEGWPDIGLYLASAGSLLFLAAWVMRRRYAVDDAKGTKTTLQELT